MLPTAPLVAFIIASFTGKVMRRHGGPASRSIPCRLRSRFGKALISAGHLTTRWAEPRRMQARRARACPPSSPRVDKHRPPRANSGQLRSAAKGGPDRLVDWGSGKRSGPICLSGGKGRFSPTLTGWAPPPEVAIKNNGSAAHPTAQFRSGPDTAYDPGECVIQFVRKLAGLNRTVLDEAAISEFVVDGKKTDRKDYNQSGEGHGTRSENV